MAASWFGIFWKYFSGIPEKKRIKQMKGNSSNCYNSTNWLLRSKAIHHLLSRYRIVMHSSDIKVSILNQFSCNLTFTHSQVQSRRYTIAISSYDIIIVILKQFSSNLSLKARTKAVGIQLRCPHLIYDSIKGILTKKLLCFKPHILGWNGVGLRSFGPKYR